MVGIYKIENIATGKIYIGSSLNIEKRLRRHKNDLSNNKHHNIHLQREFNKYGIDTFIFDVVEYCEEDKLKMTEQKHLNFIFSNDKYYEKYYNISEKSSGGDNISKNPNRDAIISKIKKSLIERYENESIEEKEIRVQNILGDKNPNYGNRWSTEQKMNMSRQRKGKESKIKGKKFEEIYGIERANEMKTAHSNRMKGKLVGEKNGFYNKKHSEENLLFYSESQKGKPNKGILSRLKPFYVDNDIYYTLNHAAKILGINYLTIRYRLNSKKYKNYVYILDEILIEKLKNDYINQETI